MKKKSIVVLLAMTSFLAVSCQKAGEKRPIKAKVGTATTKAGDAKAQDTASVKQYTEQCSNDLIQKNNQFNNFGKQFQVSINDAKVKNDPEALQALGNSGKQLCDELTVLFKNVKEDGCLDKNAKTTIEKEKIEKNCLVVAQNTKVSNTAAVSSLDRQKKEEALTKNLEQIQKNNYVMSKNLVALLDLEAVNWKKVLVGDMVLENSNDIQQALTSETKPVCSIVGLDSDVELNENNLTFQVSDIVDLETVSMPNQKDLRQGQKSMGLQLSFKDSNDDVSIVTLACLNIAKHEITQKLLTDTLGVKATAKQNLVDEEKSESASSDATRASGDSTKANSDVLKTQVIVERQGDTVSASGDASRSSGDATKVGSSVVTLKKGSGAVEAAAGTQVPQAILSSKISGDSSKASQDVTTASGDSTKTSDDDAKANNESSVAKTSGDVDEVKPAEEKSEITGDLSSKPATAKAATTAVDTSPKAVVTNPYQSLNDLAKNKSMHFQVQRYTSLKKATYLEAVTLSANAQTNFMVNGAVVSQVVAYKAYNEGGMACRLVTKKSDEDIKDFVNENNLAQVTAVNGNANYINLYFRKDNKLMSLQCISKAEKTIGAISKTLGTSAAIVLK